MNKKRKLTEEGKRMIAFWRGMAKCKPVTVIKKEKNEEE